MTPKSKNWPEQLNDLHNGTPAALWVLGDSERLEALSESVAVVGSRIVSDYGKTVTKDISQLSSQGRKANSVGWRSRNRCNRTP